MILALMLLPEASDTAIWPALQPLVAGGALIFAVGLFDDLKGLGPVPKLVVQSAAAGVVMASGLLIQRVTLFGTSWELDWLAWPVTFAWLVGLTNAFNLIDGLDGLAAGVAALAGGACGAILIVRGHHPEAMLMAALVGAALGFLVFNFPPASIFLGDSGSLLIGFLLAATAIAGWQKGATALATGVPLLIFALPIADTLTTLARRLRSPAAENATSIGATLRRLVQPDRAHLHHRLLALGWSPTRAVMVLYAITFVLSLIALATAQTS